MLSFTDRINIKRHPYITFVIWCFLGVAFYFFWQLGLALIARNGRVVYLYYLVPVILISIAAIAASLSTKERRLGKQAALISAILLGFITDYFIKLWMAVRIGSALGEPTTNSQAFNSIPIYGFIMFAVVCAGGALTGWILATGYDRSFR